MATEANLGRQLEHIERPTTEGGRLVWELWDLAPVAEPIQCERCARHRASRMLLTVLHSGPDGGADEHAMLALCGGCLWLIAHGD